MLTGALVNTKYAIIIRRERRARKANLQSAFLVPVWESPDFTNLGVSVKLYCFRLRELYA